MNEPQSGDFISEAITPAAGVSDASAMARGEPGLPTQFAWRGRQYQLAAVLRAWKTSAPDRGELYLRRHWYEIRTACGLEMILYCERQARKGKDPKGRWFLYTLRRGG